MMGFLGSLGWVAVALGVWMLRVVSVVGRHRCLGCFGIDDPMRILVFLSSYRRFCVDSYMYMKSSWR